VSVTPTRDQSAREFEHDRKACDAEARAERESGVGEYLKTKLLWTAGGAALGFAAGAAIGFVAGGVVGLKKGADAVERGYEPQ
jgi:hypothetical protein